MTNWWTTFKTLAEIERDCEERQLSSVWEIEKINAPMKFFIYHEVDKRI